MGKIKSEIPKGHFVFRNAPNAKGERALNLQYVCNGVPVYKTTGIFFQRWQMLYCRPGQMVSS